MSQTKLVRLVLANGMPRPYTQAIQSATNPNRRDRITRIPLALCLDPDLLPLHDPYPWNPLIRILHCLDYTHSNQNQ